MQNRSARRNNIGSSHGHTHSFLTKRIVRAIAHLVLLTLFASERTEHFSNADPSVNMTRGHIRVPMVESTLPTTETADPTLAPITSTPTTRPTNTKKPSLAPTVSPESATPTLKPSVSKVPVSTEPTYAPWVSPTRAPVQPTNVLPPQPRIEEGEVVVKSDSPTASGTVVPPTKKKPSFFDRTQDTWTTGMKIGYLFIELFIVTFICACMYLLGYLFPEKCGCCVYVCM